MCLRFKTVNPSTNLLALPVSANWAKLANIQEFEISRCQEYDSDTGECKTMACSPGNSILVDTDSETNDIEAALSQVKSLSHMDTTSVYTGVTLKNLCIPGYFHEGSNFDTHFSHFKKLDLSGNLISGNLYFGEVQDWVHLEELSLAGNSLHGELPGILDELSLTKLDLSGNSFTGAMLNDWSAGCALQELDLSGNQLNGTWPENLNECSSLHTLKLSNNALEGAISAQFFASMAIRILHLSNQVGNGGGLSGPLPPSMFEMRRPHGTIEEVKLDGNKFTGTIPAVQVSQSGNCEAWYCLNTVPVGSLTDPLNSVSGCITNVEWATNGASSDYSRFDQCTLEYVTPINGETFVYVTGEGHWDNPVQNLDVLHLHNNELDGQLPDMTPYCVSRSAGTLDEFTFHENPLAGKLPQSYAFCTGLETLKLEGLPNLEGPLPPMEPALRACSACATRQVGDQCPLGTIEQTFEQTEPYASIDGNLGDWPGVDANGNALRPDGSPGASCCRWYKCHTGEYRYNQLTNSMETRYSFFPFAGDDCTATICDSHPDDSAPAVDDSQEQMCASYQDEDACVNGRCSWDGTTCSWDGTTSPLDHFQVVSGNMDACAVLMDEYEVFAPPYWVVGGSLGYGEPDVTSHCGGTSFTDHIGVTYSSIETDGSELDTLIIDGSRMGAMSGRLPDFDNNAQLHTIDVANAAWLPGIPSLQVEAGAADCERGTNDPDCVWTPVYPRLHTLKIVDSIRPQTQDGLLYAVHPQMHLGDLHGHREMTTVRLSGNRFKGDLPNVDDPESDHVDDLRVFDVSSNQFGLGDCIDVSSGEEGGVPDCVPETLQYLYKLTTFQLNDNAMSGIVPDVFFKLPHLKNLMLSYNSYEGFSTACSSAAECTCDDAATSTILSMYHRLDRTAVIDSTGAVTSFSDQLLPPIGASLSSSNFKLDIRYNNLTALPVHQLRMFATIDAGNNQIDPAGLKGTYDGRSVDVFSVLDETGCNAYTYPSLRNLDLSANPIGDCAASDNPATCRNDLETMMEAFSAMSQMRRLDLSDGRFSTKLEFPADWEFGTMWPDIVDLRLGGVFSGVMPYNSLGLPSGTVGMTTLHLGDGELRSPIMLGSVDAERIQSLLAAKFAPYEISYEDRRVEVQQANEVDEFTFTTVSFTVLKGASFASEDGPSPGVTAVTAARLAKDLGITYIQELDPIAQICEGFTCNYCRNADIEYCGYLGRADYSNDEDRELREAQLSGKTLEDTLNGDAPAKLKEAVEALRDGTTIQYEKKSILYDYTVRHLGCPGAGCAAGCGGSNFPEDCLEAGNYQVSFSIVEAQARAPPFFTLENIQQLELQNNDFGGELRSVYNHLDYSTISLNGGMPAKYFNSTPMVHADNLFFDGNRFSGAIPAILPAFKLATTDPCGVASPLTGIVMTPPACTPPENFIYQLIFSEATPSEVHFCSKNPATGLYACGDNVYDCPVPTVPQAFYVRNIKNDPEYGYCGCDFCSQFDDTGTLLRECVPGCECPDEQACECVSGQHTLLRDANGDVTGLGPVCEINPYTDCSDRVSKFSYTHQIYDSADCTCPTGSDCASTMDMSSTNDHATDACRPFCSECQPGRYASSTNALECDLCDPGHFSSQYGQTECDACKRGKFSEGGGAAGGGACKLCPVGFYGAFEGSAACEPAPRGTYVNFEGAYCLDPPDKIPGVWAGTTCDLINATESDFPVGPRHCNGGKHASGYNSTECQDCEPGRFSLPAGMYRECAPCPAGTMNDPSTTESATLCSSCEPGRYQSAEGSHECVEAPIGSFVPETGYEKAVKCTGNTVAPYPALSECEACPPKLKPDADHILCVPCSPFGTEEGCEPDKMTVIGLGGAIAVVVVIVLLSLYKCHSDSKHKQAREHTRKARANR